MIKELLANTVFMYSNRYNLTTCALKKQTKPMFGTILSLD